MTNTDNELSIIYKMSLLKFLNNCLVPILGNNSRSKWFSKNGLVQQVIILVVMLFICEIIRIIFNPEFLLKYALRTIEKYKGEKSETTQIQANKMFENEEAVFNKTISIIIVFCLTIIFYLPLIPGLSVIGIFGMVAFYWILKVLVLRRMAIKKSVSAKMLINASSNMKFVVLSNAIMAFLFFNILLQRISIPAIISLIISSIFFLLPVQEILSKRFVKAVDRDNSGSYEDYFKKFKHYDLLNPVTKARGESRLEGKSLRDAIRRCILTRLKKQINKNESTKMEGLLDDGFGVSGFNMFLESTKSDNKNCTTIFKTDNSSENAYKNLMDENSKHEEHKSEESMNND